VSPETISNVERARHAPSLATLDKIMNALEVSAAEFFGADGSPGRVE